VLTWTNIYVDQNPRIEKVVDRLFEGEEAVLHVIERMAPLGLRVDGSSPWVDARLPDGSRVQTEILSDPLSPPMYLLIVSGRDRHSPDCLFPSLCQMRAKGEDE
jgi:pilus assembly protein CpaF